MQIDSRFAQDCYQVVALHDDDADVHHIIEEVASKNQLAATSIYSTGLLVLSKFVTKLVQWDHNLKIKEEDWIKSRVQIFLDATVGTITGLKASWSAYTLKVHPPLKDNKEAFLPDYVLFNDDINSRFNIEFMVMEAETHATNRFESDLVRIGKQLQILVDKMILQGVERLVAVG